MRRRRLCQLSRSGATHRHQLRRHGPHPLTTYRYQVRAIDAASNLGPYSTIASATTPALDTTPPTAPTGLGATASGSSQITLNWTAATDNVGVTGYGLERCQGAACTTFAQIATPSGTTYNDTGLLPSTTYQYQVRATDAAGNFSGYSNMPAPPPPPPPAWWTPTLLLKGPHHHRGCPATATPAR